jgi:hypothetical protein
VPPGLATRGLDGLLSREVRPRALAIGPPRFAQSLRRTRGSGHGAYLPGRARSRLQEFPEQLVVLRERWPLAFPTNHEDVQPQAPIAEAPTL